MRVNRLITCLTASVGLLTTQACQPPEETPSSRINISNFATVNDSKLNEISGIETLPGPQFLVHNDDGGPLIWLLDANGDVIRKLRIEGAHNRDWEDLTRIRHKGRSILAVGDIGDNLGLRDSIQLYFVAMPASGIPDTPKLIHTLELTYPDGARDCEALAFDSSSDSLLFLTKGDRPPRLYRVEIKQALTQSALELEFLGTVPTFRPPGPDDVRAFGNHSAFVSQPTGMDINKNGDLAAIITYRSIYIYSRKPGETWFEAFQDTPREFLGPRSRAEEAIAFGPKMKTLFISAEGHPAPIFRADLPEPKMIPR